MAVGCLDWPGRGASRAGWAPQELAEIGARLGTAPAAFLCERWPIAPQAIPAADGAAGPILVAAVAGDAVAALESSRALADAVPGGVLLEVEGTRDGAYPPGRADRACAVAVIDWHLISLTLPADGAVCGEESGLPRPPG